MQDRRDLDRWINEGGKLAPEAVIEGEVAAGEDDRAEPGRRQDRSVSAAGAPGAAPNPSRPRGGDRSA